MIISWFFLTSCRSIPGASGDRDEDIAPHCHCQLRSTFTLLGTQSQVKSDPGLWWRMAFREGQYEEELGFVKDILDF